MNNNKPSAAVSALTLVMDVIVILILGVLIPVEFIGAMRYTVKDDPFLMGLAGSSGGGMLEIAGGQVDPLFPLILGGILIVLFLAMIFFLNRSGAQRFFGSLGAVFAVSGAVFTAVAFLMPRFIDGADEGVRQLLIPVSDAALGVSPLMALGSFVAGAFFICISRIIAAVKRRDR